VCKCASISFNPRPRQKPKDDSTNAGLQCGQIYLGRSQTVTGATHKNGQKGKEIEAHQKDEEAKQEDAEATEEDGEAAEEDEKGRYEGHEGEQVGQSAN
jgi:hypothetical protein